MTDFMNLTSVLLFDEPRDKRGLCIPHMIPTRNVIAEVKALNQKSQCTEECSLSQKLQCNRAHLTKARVLSRKTSLLKYLEKYHSNLR